MDPQSDWAYFDEAANRSANLSNTLFRELSITGGPMLTLRIKKTKLGFFGFLKIVTFIHGWFGNRKTCCNLICCKFSVTAVRDCKTFFQILYSVNLILSL
jgi:hypothetical protein